MTTFQAITVNQATALEVNHKNTLAESAPIEQDSPEIKFKVQDTAFNRMFFSYCQGVAAEFGDLPSKSKKRQAGSYGWETTTANNYCRVGKFLGSLPPENIELLDPNTMMAIAKEQYQPIHEILATTKLTVKEVRKLLKDINALGKKEKAPAKQIEWCGNPRQLKLLLPDGSSSMEFERNYQEMSSVFHEHVEASLPIELYIEQVNAVIDANKEAIAIGLGIKPDTQCPMPDTQDLTPDTQLPTPDSQENALNFEVGNRVVVVKDNRGKVGKKGIIIKRLSPIIFDGWEVRLDDDKDSYMTYFFRDSQLATEAIICFDSRFSS